MAWIHAKQIARVILDGFERHYCLFQQITRGARARFEEADWQGVQDASPERIHYYDLRVSETIDLLREAFGIDGLERERESLDLERQGQAQARERAERALAALAEHERWLREAGWVQLDQPWYLGRPVLVTRNDRQIDLYNGDVGVVLEGRDGEGRTVGGFDLDELRSIQDFTVKYQLAGVPGVSEVASIGGYVRE